MNGDGRPDPDALLAEVAKEEAAEGRGRLKIFLGAAPGVGKTYAMLEAARREQQAGRDVVVGLLETHGRAETRALQEGLPHIPRRVTTHRGRRLEEFDLDAALARKPGLLLVDELAHTNAEGSRHRKRWQDVEELLDAGIDVWTTLNVQHLESQNDVVASVTGVIVRETVPDGVLSRAHEVELVDLPPAALLERLAEGKVYGPEESRRAAAGFFRLGNLLALRELALRSTADRVDDDVQAYRKKAGIETTWHVSEHVLVCVGKDPSSADLVRRGRRMADRLDGTFTVLHVESTRNPISEDERSRVTQHLRLAEQLGADVATRQGDRVAEEILAFSRAHNVTRLLLGRPSRSRLRELFFGSLVDSVVRGSVGLDVIVSAGEAGAAVSAGRWAQIGIPARSSPLAHYGAAAGVVAVATVLSRLLLGQFDLANFVMIYLLGIVIVATRFGRGPSVVASIGSVLAFDFFFVPPHLTFAVSDVRHLFTFAVLLLVGLLVSGLTVRLSRQAEAAREREARTTALYWLTRSLAGARGTADIVAAATKAFEKVFEGRFRLFLPGEDGRLDLTGHALDERETGAAQWAFAHEEPAGLGTATLPAARALYLPLSSGASIAGILAMEPRDPARIEEPEERQLLATFCKQTALALERARLAEEAEEALRRAEKEELKTSLLSSVSHDLRTPLAAITGAASTLLGQLSPGASDSLGASDSRGASDKDLLETIAEEATRLERLVLNVLEMTRLESGTIAVRKEWMPLEEVIGSALNRTEAILEGNRVNVLLPTGLPLVPIDEVLLSQVFVNLLENVARYTAAGTPVEIAAKALPGAVEVEIRDRGPGLPAGDPARLFEKFFRGDRSGSTGTGLGLAICRAIVTAHGGRIDARNREGGGAVFRFTLPFEGAPPRVAAEESVA